MKNKKQKPSEKLVAALRREYLPTEIMKYIGQIRAIEVNAIWRATPQGIAAGKKEDGYEGEDLKMALEKQEENRQILLTKVDFLKDLYDQEEKLYVQGNRA